MNNKKDITIEKRKEKVKKTVSKIRCYKHKDYTCKYYCISYGCSYGLICDACEDIDHNILNHNDIDNSSTNNLHDASSLIDRIYKRGVHYDNNILQDNISVDEHKVLNDRYNRLISDRNRQEKDIGKNIDACIDSIIRKITFRFNSLKKSLVDELYSIYNSEIERYNSMIHTTNNLLLKHTHSVGILTDSIYNDADIDSNHISQTIQSYMNSTYTRKDVKDMRYIRYNIDHIDGINIIHTDINTLNQHININIYHEIEHMFSMIHDITTITHIYSMKDDEKEIVLEGKDGMRRVSEDRYVSCIGMFDKYMIVGYMDGIMRLYNMEDIAVVSSDNDSISYIYESFNTIHSISINNIHVYKRYDTYVICSSDISNRLSYSMYSNGMISLHYTIHNAHSSSIRKIISLGRSSFVVTYSMNDHIKIWNIIDKYLCIVVDQYTIYTPYDICISTDSMYICSICDNNTIRTYNMQYTIVSSNIVYSTYKCAKMDTHAYDRCIYDDRYIYIVSNNTIHVYDMHTLHTHDVRVYDVHSHDIYTVHSDDTIYILLYDDGNTYVYDIHMNMIHTVYNVYVYDHILSYIYTNRMFIFIHTDMYHIRISNI